VRRVLAADEKPLHWVGSSKRDFLSFPAAVKEDMGNALGIAQFGGTAPTAKPWKGLGPGVLEVVESHDGNACLRPASGRPNGMSILSPSG
jgi:phage-related protein